VRWIIKNIMIICAMIVVQAKSAKQNISLDIFVDCEKREHDSISQSHMLGDGNDKDRYKDHLHSLAQMYEEFLEFGVLMAEGLYF